MFFFSKEEEGIKGKYAARSWDGFVCKFQGVGAQQPVCYVIIYACRQILFRKVHKIPKRFQLSFGLAPKRNLGNPQIMKYLCQWQRGAEFVIANLLVPQPLGNVQSKSAM